MNSPSILPLYATDGTGTWHIHADIYNVLLVRAEIALPPPLGPPSNLLQDGTLQWRGQQKRFPELAHATSVAATSHTLAVTLPTSHHVFLVALT